MDDITIADNHLNAVLAALGSSLIIHPSALANAVAIALSKFEWADNLTMLESKNGEAKAHVRTTLAAARKLIKLLDGSNQNRDLISAGLVPLMTSPRLNAYMIAEDMLDALRQFETVAAHVVALPVVKPPSAVNKLLAELSKVYTMATGKPVTFTTNPITDVVSSEFYDFWCASTVYVLGKNPPGPDAIRKRLERQNTRIVKKSKGRPFADNATRGLVTRHPNEGADDKNDRELRSSGDRKTGKKPRTATARLAET
jgi:hypothetical protein